MPQDYPVGTILFPTAVAYIGDFGGIFHNRDMLPGPARGEAPWIWGMRVTLQGSNGYKHEPDWFGFKSSNGTACMSVGPVGSNKIVTFVRVESVEIAMQKGPDAYGPSR